MKGRLLVLEGIDGCGKTTQFHHLAKWLPSSGLIPRGANLLLTCEPGGTALGQALRKLLLNPPYEEEPEPIAELLLYAADRAQHVSQVIKPALEKGDWVLSDRFSGSTLAYQGYGRNLDFQIIKQLEAIATFGLVADMTICFELSPLESLARRKAKLDDRIESEGFDFLEKVAKGFLELSQENGWIVINAEQKIEVVSQLLEKEIIQRFSSNRGI